MSMDQLRKVANEMSYVGQGVGHPGLIMVANDMGNCCKRSSGAPTQHVMHF